MNLDSYIDIVKTDGRCSLVDANKNIAPVLIDNDEYYLPFVNELVEIIGSGNVTVVGNSNDFHNIAVTLARQNREDQAYSILSVGIKRSPNSPDLLADLLKYGLSCGKIAESRNYFENLMRIDRSLWTWRAYDFAIDYLIEEVREQALHSTEMERAKKTTFELTSAYLEAFSRDDRSMFEYFTALDSFGEKEIARSILLEAADSEHPSPRCSLRLADGLFEEGKYCEALKYANEAFSYAIGIQKSISIAYASILIAMCEFSLLRSLASSPDVDEDELDRGILVSQMSFDRAEQLSKDDPNFSLQLYELKNMFEAEMTYQQGSL